MSKVKKKRNSRKFVMVQSTEDEKGRYQMYAEIDGHIHTASWFRALAYERMRKLGTIKKKGRSNGRKRGCTGV